MENKKTKIISIASIIALALTLVTATFAYFMAQTGEGKSTDIKINASTVDTFTFETGSAISLNINQDNFASGAGNQTGTTYAKVMLSANNKTNTATEHYYVYLIISENTFAYTQNENTPEILLTIKDASDNEITNVSGLTYKTVKDGKGTSISGFDITTKSGVVTLFDNREITTTNSITENWNITVTFINYNADQSKNTGRSFNGKILIQREEIIANITDVCSRGNNLTSCLTELGIRGKLSLTNLYHHDNSLTNGTGDNSYRYAGGDYVITDFGKSTGATMMIGYSNTATTSLIDFYCNEKKQYVGYTCGVSQTHYYLLKGDLKRYQSYSEVLNAAIEKGYLTQNNVKNFICFGSTESPCPTENLYRIIGVIEDKVKLIKHDYAKSSLLGMDGDYSQESSIYYYSGEQGKNYLSNSLYYWNNDKLTNIWSESLLNKINLNTNYINNIGTTWSSKIATTTWKVGGNTLANIGTSQMNIIYKNEIKTPSTSSTYEDKVGLMYVSDYGYAANPAYWTYVGNDSDYSKSYGYAKGENWLYGGGWDWTISPRSDSSNYAYGIGGGGVVGNNKVNISSGVRPCFHLESSVTYVSGSGTMSDPIIIN